MPLVIITNSPKDEPTWYTGLEGLVIYVWELDHKNYGCSYNYPLTSGAPYIDITKVELLPLLLTINKSDTLIWQKYEE